MTVGQAIDITTFVGRKPRGERHHLSLDQFIRLLTTRQRVLTKQNAPAFSATRYLESYTHIYRPDRGPVEVYDITAPDVWRCAEGIECATALVLDLDDAPPEWTRIQHAGVLAIGFTTFSHRPENPRWRLVVPLAEPVLAEMWPSAFEIGLQAFAPNADRGCSSIAQPFWLPGGPPDTAHLFETRVLDGALWTPEGLTEAHAQRVAEQQAHTRTRPADGRPPAPWERAQALRLLEATCRKLAEHEPGGRQVAAYGHGRHVGKLIASGAITEQEALDALWAAVAGPDSNQVGEEREAEVLRAVERGMARGQDDGAYVFETFEEWRAQRVRDQVARTRDLSHQRRPATRDIRGVR